MKKSTFCTPLIICFCLVLSGKSFGQQSDSVSIRFTTSVFKAISCDLKYKEYEELLPKALSIPLIQNNRFLYISNDVVGREILKSRNLDFAANAQNIVLDTTVTEIRNSLKELKIKFIISGSFVQFENRIKVNVSVIDYSLGKSEEFTLGFINLNEIYDGMADLSSEIKNRMLTMSRQELAYKIAILCPTVHDSEGKSEIFTRKLFKDLSTGVGYELIPLRKSLELCDGSKREMKRLNTDAFVLLDELTYDTLRLSFFTGTDNRNQKLTIAETNLNSSVDYEWLLSQSVSFINSILYLKTKDFTLSQSYLDTLSYSYALQKAGEYERTAPHVAAMYFYIALKRNSNSLDALIRLATIKFKQSDATIALRLYSNAYAIDSTNTEVLEGLGNVYCFMLNGDSALYYFSKLQSVNPNYSNSHLLISKGYFIAGNNEGAKNEGLLALAQNNNAETNNLLGQIYLNEKNLDTAQLYFQSAYAFDVNNQELKSVNAYIYKTKAEENWLYGNYENAKQLFESASIYQSDKYILDRLRLIYNRMSLFNQSDSVIKLMLKNNMYTEGDIYLKQGIDLKSIPDSSKFPIDSVVVYCKPCLNKAAEYFNKYKQLYPESRQAYRQLGSTYFRLEQFDMAHQFYFKNLQYDTSTVSFLDLAELYLMLKDSAEKSILITDRIICTHTADSNFNSHYYLARYLNNMAHAIINHDTEKVNDDWEDIEKSVANYVINENKNLSGWSYNIFYDWMKNYSPVTRVIKQSILKKTRFMMRHTS